MEYPIHMTERDANKIKYEVISDNLKIHLTRILRSGARDRDADIELIHQNRLINRSRTIAGKTIYVLESDEDGYYHPAVHAWHIGEIELVFRNLSTPQLADFLAELVEDNFMDIDEINKLLKHDGVSFTLVKTTGIGFDNDTVRINVMELEELDQSESKTEKHPNIRLLVSRMDNALEEKDYANVLHTSASIFETLAKIVISRPSIENKTLKSFFDRYRKDSKLPEVILDYILSIYEERNVTPLAGHGGTTKPDIDKEKATILAEMTRAFIQIEYRLKING